MLIKNYFCINRYNLLRRQIFDSESICLNFTWNYKNNINLKINYVYVYPPMNGSKGCPQTIAKIANKMINFIDELIFLSKINFVF